jgi:hypothetical protein
MAGRFSESARATQWVFAAAWPISDTILVFGEAEETNDELESE